ncbi:MAG: hypothetical protein RMA76_42775 [Deltaproteobacteria bacterium]|jgi:hypothetical protein
MTRRLRASDFDPPARTFTQRLVRNMGQDYQPTNIMGQPMRRVPSGRATDHDPQPRTFTQYLVSRMNGDVWEG